MATTNPGRSTAKPKTRYRVEQVADELDHRFHCDPCGEMPAGPHLLAAKARARRHAAANPTHEVWMSHCVMTHFFARPVGNAGQAAAR